MQNEEILERTQEIYKPEVTYLKEFSAEFPNANGVFSLGDTFYTAEKLNHMTSIEAQLCLNQLSYAAFARWLQERQISDLNISLEKYLELMKENMFVINSQIKFRKPIETNKRIKGEMKVVRTRRHGNLYLAFIEHEFEGGKEEGTLELALKLD